MSEFIRDTHRTGYLHYPDIPQALQLHVVDFFQNNDAQSSMAHQSIVVQAWKAYEDTHDHPVEAQNFLKRVLAEARRKRIDEIILLER